MKNDFSRRNLGFIKKDKKHQVMAQIEPNPSGYTWRLVAAALTPFALASAYLFFSRWPSYHFTTLSDYAGLAVSMIIGTVFVATLPIRLSQRILYLVVYIPLLAVSLFFFTFVFIAVFFGDAL